MKNSIAKIQPTMYGIFFEDINFAADGGLYAEMIKNRSFEFEDPKMGWTEPNSEKYYMNTKSGFAHVTRYSGVNTNRNYVSIKVEDEQGYSLINEGFRGMGIKKGAHYNMSLYAAIGEGNISKIKIAFIDADGKDLGNTSISIRGSNWKKYDTVLTPTITEAKAKLSITFQGTGTVNLDMVSLFPEDTWKGRKYGMRKDLVKLLDDLDPGFLRFPGGCIVEGRTLAQRYQWKKTVGPLADRELLINRWNTEFAHRPAPDYFQSFGLGFFEYFQLAEDMEAEPLPILGCGIACQFNTGELVPLEDLDPYVQDALDLIEFANGDIDTPWGQVRNEMGHPEPFNMKYIGIGNEQWGSVYIERYKVFEKAIKAKYPNMIIVSGSGPAAEGDYFEYGWKELKKLNAEIVDEHFYSSPEWFRENAARYDTYDRNGPKVFAGEYAAQSVAITSPDNKNNWECALSEAAFMTGLERNADVVHLTSYAPLMAHSEGWQWTPDMIWFDNLESYGTPNYYVQKMFGTHRGTDVLSIQENGKPLTGQHDLYASATKDTDSREVLIKLVNTSDKDQTLNIDFKGQKLADSGRGLVLRANNLEEVNSFEFPKKISPQPSEVALRKNKTKVVLPAYTFMIIKAKME
nr:alpha-L-arabinofuranosidase C-terminal domain-containing protein [Maribacter arenosus]